MAGRCGRGMWQCGDSPLTLFLDPLTLFHDSLTLFLEPLTLFLDPLTRETTMDSPADAQSMRPRPARASRLARPARPTHTTTP
jgi:hypothetical protein